ncbi:hypothetical protein RMSM_04461 [Rhodopirellula maiorica SM1]|uniref:Uncharacterized protein n=1 Tax=Rhodopirellula maiorica SM1 TaxID=1265738 RepID=M5RT90_9BACT|nr:hypothetical protein [Rhodopirellula maiorica]EMI18602.1 hypothetical protein RMSM_04461 [Rhodopirellula maiorica SM1]
MHTIILPYFSEAEIDRYERILDHMLSMEAPKCEFEFLLSASPRTEPSDRLMQLASRVAPARHLHCPTQVFGYPFGATAMFWDSMREVARDSQGNDGFALWMESDMCPVSSDWLDRLDDQWQCSGDVLVMGCEVPDVEFRKKFRFYRPFRHRPVKKWISKHINGGACYRLDLVHQVSPEFQGGIFDVRLGDLLREQGGYCSTPSIAFSTLDRLQKDLHDPDKVLLHGYLQDKDAFLTACITGEAVAAPSTERRIFFGRFSPRTKIHPSEVMLAAILKAKEPELPALKIVERIASSRVETVSMPAAATNTSQQAKAA